MVLPAFVDGGASLVWTWFATAWTYAILAVPILLSPRSSVDAAIRRSASPPTRAPPRCVLALIGFLRWVFVVPTAGRLVCRRGRDDPGGRGGSLDRPAPVRRGAARGAPGAAARRRLVDHAERRSSSAVESSPAGSVRRASWSALSTCSTRATSWPRPSLASRSGTWPACSAAPAGGCGSPLWGSSCSGPSDRRNRHPRPSPTPRRRPPRDPGRLPRAAGADACVTGTPRTERRQS